MNQLPDESTMTELLSMGKELEDKARKVYEMSESFAQKYQQSQSDRAVTNLDKIDSSRLIK